MGFSSGLIYKASGSPLSRVEPRVKALAFSALVGWALAIGSPTVLGMVLVGLYPLAIAGRAGREWLLTLWRLLPLLCALFAFQLLQTLLSGGISLSWETLEAGFMVLLRFAVIVSAFSLFSLTTSPEAFGGALQQSRFPPGLALAFTMAVRFLPLLAEEAQAVSEAQRSRGLELERGGPVTRLRNHIPLLTPLVVGSIRRSIQVAEAMESRGYGLTGRRTTLRRLKLSLCDYVILAASAVALSLMIVSQVWSWVLTAT